MSRYQHFVSTGSIDELALVALCVGLIGMIAIYAAVVKRGAKR
jgi:hypothetical protein